MKVLLPVSLFALASLAACGSDPDPDSSDEASDVVTVVASTNVWGDVASAVGGDLVEVTSVITDSSQDPHGFEADADTLLAVSRADLVVANGGGYDDFIDTMVSSSESDAPVVEAFEVSGLEDEAPEGAEVNEHVWYDVPSVSEVAQSIATELGEVDPDHAETYTANAETFAAELAELTAAIDELRPTVEGTPIAITEPLPVYLAEALGLDDRTPAELAEAVEEGEDVPVAVIRETLALFEDGDADVLLYNDQTTTPVTDQVRTAAEGAGVPVVPVTELLPEGTDYVTWMRGNIDAVGAALSGR